MKYIPFIFFVVLSYVSFSQNFKTGNWKGEIQLPDTLLKVELRVWDQKDTTIRAVLVEPTSTILYDSCFYGYEFNMKAPDSFLIQRNENAKKKELKQKKKSRLYSIVELSGSLDQNKNQLNGKLTLDEKVFQVTLFRDSVPIFRPQEPKMPYPYFSEDVRFRNPIDSVILSGTLTIPAKEGKFPAVILQSGSTPLTRDGDSNHHKPNLVLADFLTRNGIAVLRYDSRGVGRSSGNFFKSTPLDLSGDLLTGREFLVSRKEIITDKIGIIGHSEGGMVATMAASQTSDINLIVMLGAPGLRLRKVFEDQQYLRFEDGEFSVKKYELYKKIDEKLYELVDKTIESKAIRDSLMQFKDQLYHLMADTIPLNSSKRQNIETNGEFLLSLKATPHNVFNLSVNPADYIENVTCPVLSLGGSLDRLVSSKENQEAIKEALIKGGNKDFQIIELEGLNHSFQECETGTIKETMKIEQTFSPKALEIITNWILNHVDEQK